jgi:hypothetical protein
MTKPRLSGDSGRWVLSYEQGSLVTRHFAFVNDNGSLGSRLSGFSVFSVHRGSEHKTIRSGRSPFVRTGGLRPSPGEVCLGATRDVRHVP